MIKFPNGFFWGAATSAHQVEGNNVYSDWWEWERKAGLKEVSGEACRQYDLFCQDFDLARQLNHNAHRLSIEWSRIEPAAGNFSDKEISHYLDVILALKERHLEPIVTLHHFTNPQWFFNLGGWKQRHAPAYFLRYVERIVGALSSHVRYWVTINEPLVYASHAFLFGVWPPQEKSLLKTKIVADNLAVAHIKAYRLIHRLYEKNNLPPPSVSIAQNMQAFLPCSLSLRNKIAVSIREHFINFNFIDTLVRHKSLDFIGLNYYARSLVETEGWLPRNLAFDVCRKNHHPLKKNYMGWDIYPQGIYKIASQLHRYGLPIFILENGICTQNDSQRWEYISAHLRHLHRAISEGVKCLGYIYWSLLDNYEWDKGFGPRFGLIEVDYANFRRTVRESARQFAMICKNNGMD